MAPSGSEVHRSSSSPSGASLAEISGPVSDVATVPEFQAAVQQHAHHIVITADLEGGAIPTMVDIRDPGNSNTLIEGINSSITLVNLQLRIIDDTATGAVHDITVRNLTSHGRISDLVGLSGSQTKPGGVGTNYEAVSVRGARNITIDHITAYDFTDDLMSVAVKADNVTISNSNLYYTRAFADIDPSIKWDWGYGAQPLADERLGIIVGYQPADSYFANGLLHVTLSNNHIGPLVRGRPLLRGYVRVLNNTFDNTAAGSKQYAAIEVGSGGYVVVSGNTFDHSNNPIVVHLNSPGDQYRLYESANTFINTTGVTDPGQGAPPGSSSSSENAAGRP
ncbi:hypothetical protein [Curtobacterium flaccumfaciens]|uniref:hypothetical protein n=1 Tax=Curtobacterium flaccumfaciens TaxID=2035 RepID=UPI001BDEFA9B|nr:hypothetical protein [Curtobacterium flaccumfaciens]MBT1631565.1 hypothetical protein [Curtobacterium flaccumfaciens pv. oortii]MCX2846873.1 hypothetical protein [Curtobacterium flaccumfaciens pv. oortii]